MNNPDESLKALVEPSPVTLGQMALLDLRGCPLVLGEWGDLARTLEGLYILSMPLERAIEASRNPSNALLWGDTLSPAEYRSRLKAALDGITAFYRMLPRAEDGSKKNGSETDSSPSSPSGSAARTAGRSDTRSPGSRPSRLPSSGAAGRRASAGSSPARSRNTSSRSACGAQRPPERH